MGETVRLKGQIRQRTGTGGSNELRRADLVPAVVYGPDLQEPLAVQVDGKELRQVLAVGQRGVVYLDVTGVGEYPVMVKEVQRDRLKGDIIHLDFYMVSLTRKVTTSVPIHLVGSAPGVKEGGVLQHQLWEVDIECLPGQLPEYLEADISSLEVGYSLSVGELTPQPGIEILTPAGDTVVTVLAPTLEAEEDPEETDENAGEAPEEAQEEE